MAEGVAQGTGSQRIGTQVQLDMVSQGRYNYDSKLEVETFQRGSRDYVFTPKGGISQNGPFHFDIPAIPSHAIDMKQMSVYLKVKIVNEDGTNLVYTADDATINDWDIVAPVNLFMGAFIQNVHLYIYNQPFNPMSGQNTHYKAFSNTMLGYNDDARTTHLVAQGFYIDHPGTHENFSLKEKEQGEAIPGTANPILYKVKHRNGGYLSRFQRVRASQEYECMGPIHHPFINANNNLAPEVKLDLRFDRSSDSFLLKTNSVTKKYKVQILEFTLNVRYIQVPEDYRAPRLQAYTFIDSELHSTVLVAGTPSTRITLTNESQVMPKAVTSFMVKTDAVQGSYNLNPFNIEHFFIQNFSLLVNGVRTPSEGLRMDFTNEDNPTAMQAYYSVFQNTGIHRMDLGNSISWANFIQGTTFFPQDLNPEKCNFYHTHQGVKGRLEMDIEFSKQLEQNVTLFYNMMKRKVLLLDTHTGFHNTLEISP